MGVRVDTQRAARRRLQRARDIVGLLDIGEDLDAAVVIGATDLGHADLARRAVEQASAQALLQRLDVIAHHGRGHVELAPGGGKPAAVDDADERGEAGQAIHGPRLLLAVT